MPAAGTIIHALGPKLEVIWTCMHRAGKLRTPNLRGLAEAADINLQTLKSSRSKSSLTDVTAMKLSRFAGFDHGDHRWHDANISIGLRSLADKTYPGRDTVTAFRSMMHRLHDLGGTHVHLGTAGLRHLDTRLASFQVDASGQHSQEGEPAELLMTINLETSDEGGVRFGFRRVHVEMTLPAGKRVEVADRLGHRNPHRLKDAILTAVGGSMNPQWHLERDDDVLKGEYATTDRALGTLSRLDVGDAMVVKLSARITDGDVRVLEGGDDLSADQEAVIRALFQRSMAGVEDRGGWLTLALQNLEVKRGDD
ncbi:hypothetical protein [Devosia sediminis]|uniref:Uncharacterized protein n=1 Tax=Devosia sediminis TaxID=2798801 RepID=A0A934J153_9HYPH|nr:hypothetical protein [Devosia sediminis]MBJ3786358.1 hypothetical protein [Devosia sediminis]